MPEQRRENHMPKLGIKRLSPGSLFPLRGSGQAIGLDLHSVQLDKNGQSYKTLLQPHKVNLISTGIALEIPEGYYGRIAPRSGLSIKGVDVLAGVIDRDYTGEIKVVLINHTEDVVIINHQDRIAQLIMEKADILEIKPIDELSQTNRGSKGFGSTGE